MSESDSLKRNVIAVKGAREHNLKNIDIEIPRNSMVVFTGVSGSGKSSLVFDTIYAEGQRRYVESLSSYARQFLERINKPDIDYIYGISPAVAIEQKTGSRNPRSTVATSTEIYDFLKLLFSRLGKTICFVCGKEVVKETTATVSLKIEALGENTKLFIGFPLQTHSGKSAAEETDLLKRKGFFRIYAPVGLIDLNEEMLPESRDGLYVIIERYKVEKGKVRDTLAETIETCFKEGEGRMSVIEAENGIAHNFNKFYECCGIRYEEPEPRFFSFNNPFGACPVCQGFGRIMGIDMDLVIPDHRFSIRDGAIAAFRGTKSSGMLRELLRAAPAAGIPVDIPYSELTAEQKGMIEKGFKGFPGINPFFEKLQENTYKMHIRVLLSRFRGYTTCTACRGSRLRREALQVKINELSIFDIVKMTIEEAAETIRNLNFSAYEIAVGGRILDELNKRLAFLNNVGLGYLTLNRLSNTLSGGETQRINLASSLGSALMGTLYVLDEPSIGLHPRDNVKLINVLKSLRDIGNTVLVVEHDPEMMKHADMIVDMGPAAGVHGGEIVAQGTYKEITKNKESLTGKYLSGKLSIPVPKKRRTAAGQSIKITGAIENNLKNIDVEFPLNKMVVVTGISGSGKSTLVHDVLYGGLAKILGKNPPKIGRYLDIEGIKAVDEIEIVDQSPIGKSPRSNPISYVNGFDKIRELFASTPEAKNKGFAPGYFSFNVPGGRCETCQGEGFVKIEMQFLADLYLECESCKGTRFKKEIKDITYRDKNIVDVLNMTVDEALGYFAGNNRIVFILQKLSDVGLGYIKLGQPSNTLSGGEAQRVKLAYNLSGQKEDKHTLFIFDEPTTGLHFADISKLLKCFDMLIESNNSVVIIEHNLDVIKSADYIIDLGPEAGIKGGEVIATGTPEEIAACPNSATGKFLKNLLVNLS